MFHAITSRRSKDDDPFGSTLQGSNSLLQGSEDTSGFHNKFSTDVTPFDVSEISLQEDGDGLPILSLDCALELSMGGIILGHGDHVLRSMKVLLMETIFTLPELKAALVTRHPT